MGETIYGASVWNERNGSTTYNYDTLGKSSEVVAVGDVLTITSGELLVAAPTSAIVGVAARAYTAAQMGTTNTTVYPPYIPAYQDTLFLMGTDSDLTDNTTNGGTFYALTAGGTGTQQVFVSAGVKTTTERIVEIVKVDPKGLGGSGSGSGLRQCLVRFVKTPWSNIDIYD